MLESMAFLEYLYTAGVLIITVLDLFLKGVEKYGLPS